MEKHVLQKLAELFLLRTFYENWQNYAFHENWQNLHILSSLEEMMEQHLESLRKISQYLSIVLNRNNTGEIRK